MLSQEPLKSNGNGLQRLRQTRVMLATILLGLAGSAYSQSPDAFNPVLNYWVGAMAVQVDGKVVFGGDFTSGSGQSRSRIARVNADGTLDSVFNPGASDDIYALAIQPDGKILVGGDFTILGGQTRRALGRLNTNGTLDTTFNTSIFNPPPGYTLTARAQAIVVQPDGKIVVGGKKTITPSVGPSLTSGFVSRLNANGSTDPAFSTSGVSGGPVTALGLQSDGRILVGGLFSAIGGQSRSRIARLNADGSLDTGFNPGLAGTSSITPMALSFTVQPNDQIIVGGSFIGVAGQPRTNLCRLLADGTLDGEFNPVVAGISYPVVYSLALQTDGKILVGGIFTTLNGASHSRIGRLNPDGTVDSSFGCGANSDVYGLALQPDGRVLAGGLFTQLGGQSRSFVGRLQGTGPATQSLSYDGWTITWLRGGTSPEAWLTTFEVSTNGSDWNYLGAGTRIVGGWELTGVALSADARIRARGYVSGASNGSSWFAETISGPCFFVMQPSGRTNNAGSAVAFAVSAGGTPPLNYQWYKSGIPLEDTAQVSGAQTSILSLSNVFGADSGGYSVIISNSSGSVTSAVATLKVVDPVITLQPVSRTNNAQTEAAFSVSVYGTSPWSYQWCKGSVLLTDGGNISGAQTSTLTVSNVLQADAGAYYVLVSNRFGTVASSVATLKVVEPLIVVPPMSQVATQGQTVELSVVAAGTGPLHYQWRKSGVALDGATNATLEFRNMQWTNGGNFDVIVSNSFGSVTSAVVTLTVSSAIVDSFNPGANQSVYALAIQADGKILAGGHFTELGGQSRAYIGRLNRDGSLDTDFNPGADYDVTTMLVQADGKIVVGGGFTNLCGQLRNNIGRLNPDGTLDPSFNPGASSWVNCLLEQPDGKFLVGGFFSQLGGQSRTYVGRLNRDGTLDTTFNADVDSWVNAIALQPDGRIVLAGTFNKLCGQPRDCVGRLFANGTLDTNFNAGVFVPGAGGGSYPYVDTAVAMPDGRVMIGGFFGSVNSIPCTNLARLNADGSLDSMFQPFKRSEWDSALSVTLQTSGGILIGGGFVDPNGYYDRLFRLGAEAIFDSEFNPRIDNVVEALAVQDDGDIVVGGGYQTISEQPRNCIGRLHLVEPAWQSLTTDGAQIMWMRGGPSPEVWRVSFEVSTNGTNWTALGDGTRILDGWKLTGARIPQPSVIRARGFVTGGQHNGSSWYVESTLKVDPLAPPQIITKDGDFGFRSNRFGFNVSGLPGQKVVVESSGDFADWIPVATNTLTTTTFYFADPSPPGFVRRFYRARLQ